MSKNFSKTMTLEEFKMVQKDTPTMVFDEFVDMAKIIENKMQAYNKTKKKLISLFLSRPDKFLFTYEHLPSFDDLRPSELGERMRTADNWTINKVVGSNDIIISFFNNGKSISTVPISFHEFKDFLNE